MVTKDEVDSTRGRANALRLAMSGQLPDGMANRDLPKVMELCLSCKACKAECPSSVDMARLKGELLQHHHDLYGASRKDRWVGASPELARRFAGWPARWVNMAQRLPLIKPIIMKVMGLDSRRQLPVYATQKFSAISHDGSDDTPDAVMLHDTYMECHETDSGLAALRVFELLGKKLLVLNAGCCQRPRISHGFLREAAKRVEPGIERILPWLQKGVPVFVLEPGCASAWKDDIPDLLRDDMKAEWLKNITTFEHVLAEILRRDPSLADRIRPVHHQIRVHGHCHQKSIFGMQPVRDIMAHWPEIDFAEIDSGCCGMAGSFGYEEKHYDTSRKMAERVLVPALHASPDAFVVANGFSCRHQIQDFAGVKARHIVYMFLKNK
jgi:Fe-S oxidoreductase